MNAQPKLVEEQSAESDFIDDIAELLPAEQRPLWYRDMAHLRRLPPLLCQRKIEHCRILAAMRSKSAALMALLHVVVRGTSALATHAKTEE